MNCWKTINLIKDYGAVRLLLTAVGFMILFFICNFLAFGLLRPNISLSDGHVFAFCVLLVVTLFVHKVIHVLPMICKKEKGNENVLLADADMERHTENDDADFYDQPVFIHYAVIVLCRTGISETRSLLLYDFEHSCGLLPA